MPHLLALLDLPRCPYCHVDKPLLNYQGQVETTAQIGGLKRYWKWYVCNRCGGVVTAASTNGWEGEVVDYYPKGRTVDDAIPPTARRFLAQAIDSLHAPDGSIMLCASAVDAMLKQKGYKEGTLNQRIAQAANDHLITSEMAKWAHEIRLDANEPRHADEEANPPNFQDAERVVDFVLALGEFLFVLPSRVKRGLKGETPISPEVAAVVS